MTKVVGVRFRNVGKIYYFSPKDYEIKTGELNTGKSYLHQEK